MNRALFIVFLSIVIALGWFGSRAFRVETSEKPLPQEVYVWQQDWTGSVAASLADNAHRFAGSILLVAEINWRTGQPEIRNVDLPLRALRAQNQPLGMAVRLGNFSGPYHLDSPAIEVISMVIRRHLQAWRAAGMEPSEIQIDFDCPESKLTHYRQWMKRFRTDTDGVRLTFTALPSWLDQGVFRSLAEASDGYVLQVHFYQTPQHPSDAVTLCEPEAAVRYVKQAARIGEPFRVALPTYGYRVFFGKDNRPLGIAAEGSTREWPDARSFRELQANPDELAALVRNWRQEHPAALQGIVWFRMPVPEDTLNWSWPVLGAVMNGRAPTRELAVLPTMHEDGLVELVATNQGEADVTLPRSVKVRWNGGQLIAADGVHGFGVTNRRPGVLSLARTRPVTIAAGEEKKFAWLRFTKPTEVHIE